MRIGERAALVARIDQQAAEIRQLREMLRVAASMSASFHAWVTATLDPDPAVEQDQSLFRLPGKFRRGPDGGLDVGPDHVDPDRQIAKMDAEFTGEELERILEGEHSRGAGCCAR